jgi:hypothetical protein
MMSPMKPMPQHTVVVLISVPQESPAAHATPQAPQFSTPAGTHASAQHISVAVQTAVPQSG